MSKLPRAWSWVASAAVASSALAFAGVATAQNAPAPAPAPAQGQPAQPAAAVLPAKEVPVGILGNDTLGVVSSPDAAHLAVLTKRGDKMLVSLDGADGKPYDWIVRTSLGFTRDGKTLGYVVQAGEKVMTVINGKEGKPYHEILDNGIAFGAGSRYVYFAKNDRKAKWTPVVDGNELKIELDTVGNIVYTRDAKRYAFAGEREEKRFFVVDGQETPSYAKVGGNTFRFSPDGARYAYVAERDGKLVMVVDGKEDPAYVEITPPLFSPDGKHVAYGAKIAPDKMTVILDGKPQKEFPVVFGETIQFSPDGNRIAYVVSRKSADNTDKLAYVVDNEESKEYEIVIRGSFLFSPDSKRTCFLGVRTVDVGGTPRQRVVPNLDGLELRDYDAVRLLQFSPDNRHLAFTAQRDASALVVVDGAEIGSYEGLSYLSYNTDGKRLAYVAARGNEQFMVVDNKPGKAFAAIAANNVSWSPDGKRLAYEAIPAGENAKPVLVVDQAESAPHDGTLRNTPVIWDSPNTLHCLIIRDKTVQRLEVTLPQ